LCLPPYYLIMNTTKQKIVYDSSAVIFQAGTYTDPYRVLMEYVDNSIDAAEYYFNGAKYVQDILVTVTKNTDKTITIRDNATGMNISPDESYRIFSSAKRDDSATNGMFGFGMFSFLSICGNLKIRSWNPSSMLQMEFEVTSETFTNATQQGPEIEFKYDTFENAALAGTEITLSDFHEGQFDEIYLEHLKSEIEQHFEPILRRENIRIMLTDESGESNVCTAFDYGAYCEEPFERELTEIQITHSKKVRSKRNIDISTNPVKVLLIASPTVEFDRPVFFSVKGRRVVEVRELKQFRTINKSRIWSRSNVTGYIDVTGVLTPVLTRRDFENNDNSKALYQTLLSMEDEILDYINSQSQKISTHSLEELETKINDALKDLQSPNESETVPGGRSRGKGRFRIKKMRTSIVSLPANGNRQSSSENNETRPTKNKSQRKNQTNGYQYKELILDNLKNVPNSGKLKIRIDSENEPHKDLSGDLLRSILQENTVIIFKKHPDFLSRIKTSQTGREELTSRLINLIAMEYATHLNSIENRIDSHNSLLDSYRKLVKTSLQVEELLINLEGSKF
jgi:hypothetical protein